MPTEELGHLVKVDAASLWRHEAHDFTPWLLTNAEGLADAIGIELELETAERRVGAFSLDLIGRDATNDTILIVENQLTETDHTHLGQVLTYAAGTGASTIIWISTGFRDEHRQALDWLNEHTGKDVHFFGIEIEAFKIGGSQPAPHFKVAVQPNEWQKVVRDATHGQQATGRGALYERFWDRFLERVTSEEPTWTRRQPGRTRLPNNWLDMPSPIRGAWFNVSFARGGKLRNELYIDSGDQAENNRIFEGLLVERQTLEATFGGQLDFDALEDRRAARIADYAEGDVADEGNYDQFIDWFIDSGRRLRKALQQIDVGRLNAGAPSDPFEDVRRGD